MEALSPNKKAPARFSEEKVQVLCKYSGDEGHYDLDAHAHSAPQAQAGR